MTATMIRRVGETVDAIDVFSGIGGSSRGIHAAGATVRAAANHSELSIECHAANFPDTEHWIADLVSAADPQKIDRHGHKVPGRYLDPADLPAARFAWFSPACTHQSQANATKVYEKGRQLALLEDDDWDEQAYVNSERSRVTMSCFPAETLVLTDRGLVPIAEIVVGDQVLTHRNRWRTVLATASRIAATVVTKGRGHFGIESTREHPFYARQNGKRRVAGQWQRALGEPTWRAAENLAKPSFLNQPPFSAHQRRFDGWFWSTPTAVPALPVPAIGGVRPIDQDESFWWFVGRWLGDGSLRFKPDGRGLHVHVACHIDEADELAKRLAVSDWRWSRKAAQGRGVVFETCHKALVEWLAEHFGQHASGKFLPSWVLGMPRSHRAALLDGYASADGTAARRGSTESQTWTTTTVSRSLAIGVRLLAESLGFGASLMATPPRPGQVLGGKPFTALPQYLVRWGEVTIEPRTVDDEHLRWSKVRSTEPTGREVEVFDIEVDEDHSFVADGLVVHNCVLRYVAAHHPEILVVENVLEVTKWGPGRDGSTFQWWMTELRNLGYEIKPLFLNSMFFAPCPQSRDRIYIVAWRKGNTAPDLDYRPTAFCTSDSCGGKIVEAVQTWKPRTAAWTMDTWGKYLQQYDYRCPRCRAQVHPASWMALTAIDWSNLGPTLAERIEHGNRPAEATWERIRRAVAKYRYAPPVILGSEAMAGSAVHVAHTDKRRKGDVNRSSSIDAPLPSSTSHNTVGLALDGSVLPIRSGRPRADHPGDQLATVMGNGSHLALAATIRNNGTTDGYLRADHGAEALGTIVGTGRPQSVLALVIPNRTHGAGRSTAEQLVPMTTAFASQGVVIAAAGHTSERPGQTRGHHVTEPLFAQSATNTQAVAAIPVLRGDHEQSVHPGEPLDALSAGGTHHAVVTALFSKINGGPGDTAWHGVDERLNTITGRDTTGLVVVPWIDQWLSEPVAVTEQLATLTARVRHSLASVVPSEEPITDEMLMEVRFRMLQPDPELRRAMAFEDTYILLGNKTQMTAGLGNAVTPPVAEWITGRCLATLGAEVAA